MIAGSRPTNYETSRTGRSRDDGKRSNQDTFSWRRNNMVDQETRSAAPGASGAIELNALEFPFGDYRTQSRVRETHRGEMLATPRTRRYRAPNLRSGQRSSRVDAGVTRLTGRFGGAMEQGRLEFHPPSPKKYCAGSKPNPP